MNEELLVELFRNFIKGDSRGKVEGFVIVSKDRAFSFEQSYGKFTVLLEIPDNLEEEKGV